MLILTTLLVGVAAFLFSLVPGAVMPSSTNTTDTTNTNITTNLTSPASPHVDPDLLSVTFWSYLSVRVAYG